MPPYDKYDKKKLTLSKWCEKQNRDKHILLAERIKRLTEAGFIWKEYNFKSLWEKHFNDYVKFINDNPGKKPSLKGAKDEIILNRWVQRQNEGRYRLSDEKFKRLDDIGFPWADKTVNSGEKWEARFNEYLKFIAENPGGIPSYLINGKKNPLYTWWSRQNTEKDLLSKEQIDRMNKAGFVWKITSTKERWEMMYNKYKEFVENNPEGKPVPIIRGGADSLFEWCRTQRNAKSRLNQEQIQKLDSLGFNWTAKDIEEAWEQHYQDYLEFREKNPKGMPTAYYHGKANPMHNWCRVQQRFRNQLPADRVKKLDDAGFDWFVNFPDWNDYYKDFLEYRNAYQSGMPVDEYALNKRNLFKWCQEQRENQELLPPEYIQKLNEAGFEWK
jgi:hypothetical protein